MNHILTAESLRKFDIAAEQQRDHLAKNVHAALEPFCQYPTPNLPGIDFQSLHTSRVVSYLCNYVPIFSMNLSYGTQLCQAAEYLIQLKQRQEKTITKQTDCPSLCMASTPHMALQPKALAAAGPGVGALGPALAVPDSAL